MPAVVEELSSWEFGAASNLKQRRHSSTQEFSFGPSKDSTCDDATDYDDDGDVDFDDDDNGGHGKSNDDNFEQVPHVIEHIETSCYTWDWARG